MLNELYAVNNESRSPHGERGLKLHDVVFDGNNDAKSLPARGAWIEISCAAATSRSHLSLPARGAWIEINGQAVSFDYGVPTSLPARGAWIEMYHCLIPSFPSLSRSPHGERGLKCLFSPVRF